jgi:hypothetical protein
MSTVHVADRAFDSEIDVRFVGQMSSIGALADDVISDMIRAEAGIRPLRLSVALREIEKVLHQAAPDHSSSVWDQSPTSEALRRLVPGGLRTVDDGEPVGDEARGDELWHWFNSAVADALEGSATPTELRRLRQYFKAIAAITMDAAHVTMQNRNTATSWLSR